MHRLALRLYVAGQSPNSVRALANLRAICQAHLGDSASLEVIDVLKEPARAITDSVFVTPTLVKCSPAPIRVIIGNLEKTAEVLSTLGVDTASSRDGH